MYFIYENTVLFICRTKEEEGNLKVKYSKSQVHQQKAFMKKGWMDMGVLFTSSLSPL